MFRQARIYIILVVLSITTTDGTVFNWRSYFENEKNICKYLRDGLFCVHKSGIKAYTVYDNLEEAPDKKLADTLYLTSNKKGGD